MSFGVRAFALVATFSGAVAAEPPTARIAQGELRGVEHDGVLAFRNLPFAAPPVGVALRRAFVAFARQGQPGALGPAPWPAYAPDAPWVMEVGERFEARREVIRERMDLHSARYRAALE